MSEGHRPPYWRLSAFYLAYFASLGALVPYWGLYLQARGYEAIAIGQLMAVLMATKIIAPNLWGWLADYLDRRMMVVRVASLTSLVAFLGVFVADSFLWLALVTAGYSFFWNASLPQFEANTMNHLGDRASRYAHIRLWGSVGFICTVVGLGPILDRFGVQTLPLMVALLFGTIVLASWAVPDKEGRRAPRAPARFRSVLRQPGIVMLLGIFFLLQASHGPYYSFFSLYLEDAGYTNLWVGGLWAWGVIAEILVFLIMHRLLGRWRAETILVASAVLTALRWIMLAFWVDWLPGLLVAQTLHAASFGTFHAAAIHLVHRYFPGRLQGRGQALYSSLSFGAGGALGSLVSGYVWESAGARWIYLFAAGLAALGALLSWRWLRSSAHRGGGRAGP